MAITLSKVGSATSTTPSEIPAFDPASKRLFVVAFSKVDVYTVSNTGALTAVSGAGSQLALGFTPPAGTVAFPNSVAVRNGVVAVAYEVKDSTTNAHQQGRVVFYNAADGAILKEVTVGFLPDMLTFSPDGTKVLVANEGEPNSYGQANSFDPEGSVSIINIATGAANATVQQVSFTSFNTQITQLRADGVRIYGPGATVAQDFEPEYITFSGDGTKAIVTLQENNAIAFIDIATATVTSIKPLGLKDHSVAGKGLDASDQDGGVNIKTQPIFGMYQPDAIASFTANGQTYYITANEGDSRNYTGFNEEIRVGATTGYTLDPTIFPNAATLKQNANLGRLQLTNASGDIDGDGDFDRIQALGARSFSILDASGNLVFDSGDQLEQITAQFAPTQFNSEGEFNANGTPVGFDTRSDNKGPEPEGVTIGVIGGRTYAFIGLERVGDVIVYDVTNPASPTFEQYLNPAEDRATEGLIFVSAADSPTLKPLVITASEVSNTVAVFEASVVAPKPTFQLQILHASDFEGGIAAVDDAVRFSAIVNKFKNESAYKANTLILSSGDNYIPGAFLNASSDTSLNGVGGLGTSTAPVLGRGDVAILNEIGIQASALGNHEFDLGVRQVRDIIRSSNGTGGSGNPGTAFPYLSTNLNFSPEIFNATTNPNGNLATTDLATNQTTAEASTIKGKLAKSTVITVAGNDGISFTADDQKIGIVGATTPTLPNISSSGSIIVTP